MTTAIITFLLLIQIKHWYIDFVNQTDEEVRSKGKYGDGPGLKHSAKHGIATSACVLVVAGHSYIIYALILGVLDFIAHYHIDWAKMNYGNRDIRTKEFWNHLGMDQMAHQIVYLLLAYLMT